MSEVLSENFISAKKVIDKSYSSLNLNGDFGALIGRYEEGKLQNSFAFTGEKLYSSKNTNDLWHKIQRTLRYMLTKASLLISLTLTKRFGMLEEAWRQLLNGQNKVEIFKNFRIKTYVSFISFFVFFIKFMAVFF